MFVSCTYIYSLALTKESRVKHHVFERARAWHYWHSVRHLVPPRERTPCLSWHSIRSVWSAHTDEGVHTCLLITDQALGRVAEAPCIVDIEGTCAPTVGKLTYFREATRSGLLLQLKAGLHDKHRSTRNHVLRAKLKLHMQSLAPDQRQKATKITPNLPRK